ncbi:hypothetical protein RFI_01964 [Reticulomyxa filosa]|uniref:Uncharacterized protein n=1 Tax=Reticulomyxa filosa TaxID=46433 RepID=X6PAF0_RETFI|nr:hypothetical protein RFI_01964 [Reticulomyxa filosa]|eukprot:ETO35108.1 hypothetical protein RFI_01964 [Reticulomyxa filosa]
MFSLFFLYKLETYNIHLDLYLIGYSFNPFYQNNLMFDAPNKKCCYLLNPSLKLLSHTFVFAFILSFDKTKQIIAYYLDHFDQGKDYAYNIRPLNLNERKLNNAFDDGKIQICDKCTMISLQLDNVFQYSINRFHIYFYNRYFSKTQLNSQ